MDPAEIRAPRRQAEPDRRGEERSAAGSDRRRDVRAVSRPALYRHQAVRHRGGRVADAGARSDPALSAPNSASRNSCSACRIAAGSTCWPISWASPMPRSSPNSRAMPANPEHVHGSGDVKYHLGTSTDREVGGRTRASVAGGQPVASRSGQPGRARQGARQAAPARRRRAQEGGRHPDARRRRLRRPGARRRVARIVGSARLLHRRHDPHHRQQPDRVYDEPRRRRAPAPIPSDIAKGIQAPIFHVNGDDPEAVVEVARAAVEFRQRFKKDVVIDLFCYRRHGHNESDEPAFTQPLMYRTIARHPTTRQLYAERLVAEGVLTPGRGRADGEPIRRRSRNPVRGGRRTTARTRRTGSKAPGPGSNRRPI